MTNRAWFSCLLRHPASTRSGSILTTLERARDEEANGTESYSICS